MLSTINTYIDGFLTTKQNAHWYTRLRSVFLWFLFFLLLVFLYSLLHVVCTTNYRKTFALSASPFLIYFFVVLMSRFSCHVFHVPLYMGNSSNRTFLFLFRFCVAIFDVPKLFIFCPPTLSFFLSCSPRRPPVSVLHLYLFLVRH